MRCIVIVSALLAAAQAVVAVPIFTGTHQATVEREFTSVSITLLRSRIHIHAWLCSWMLVSLRNAS
ncbi:hypothetical protein K439DRAFT_1626123 [Ramaria rubella]|nr:hypothetical protein K439DRAFT_1626123 [Ramaria rubella]